MQEQITEGMILDKLATTCKRVRSGDSVDRAVAWEWIINGSDRMRLAFDLFLVRTRDPLAHEAGTVESRIRERVRRMVAPFAPEATA